LQEREITRKKKSTVKKSGPLQCGLKKNSQRRIPGNRPKLQRREASINSELNGPAEPEERGQKRDVNKNLRLINDRGGECPKSGQQRTGPLKRPTEKKPAQPGPEGPLAEKKKWFTPRGLYLAINKVKKNFSNKKEKREMREWVPIPVPSHEGGGEKESGERGGVYPKKKVCCRGGFAAKGAQ